ncbi:MAG: serine hydroxymethyltransferase [Candidatus Brennerbacteria bacterium]
MKDKQVKKLIEREEKRQKNAIDLIASENFVSHDVLEALGSVFTNKYAEGYPAKRYYAGCETVDELEELARSRALKLFKLSPRTWSVNVQPYSGSPANLAVYLALVKPGETIMGMSLDAGGHLTHGAKISASGKLWNAVHYGVDRKTEKLDYRVMLRIAKKAKPKILIAGWSAYSRMADFKQFRKVADAVGALLMVDMSHFAGLVAGGAYSSPFPYADIVTTTMHKTLRGPRAALIFSRAEHAKAIDRAVFPGIQGGPHMNQIAAIAVALKEANRPEFKKYARQIVKNAKALAHALARLGWRIVSGGTDSHLFSVDTMEHGVSGGKAEALLQTVGILVNKESLPFDERSPSDPSGIRIGTAAVTTRGMKERDMVRLARKINDVLLSH